MDNTKIGVKVKILTEKNEEVFGRKMQIKEHTEI